ncbi:MAG TPA: hypothetical protein DCK87_04690 [Desulfotomaculum sp.]|nr:hypothetical protein [Desulfotomaculum sp.]
MEPWRKNLSLRHDLLYLLGLSFILALTIIFGKTSEDVYPTWGHYLRVILGLPFILFFPGYALIAALFPNKDDLPGIERVALSFGLSIAVVPLLGLALNYTPWGIRLLPILATLTLFIILTSGLALYRRSKLPPAERFVPALALSWPGLKEFSRLDKVLSILLVLAIFFALGSIIYVVVTPKTGEKFTEFYLLGKGHKAEGYPRHLSSGEEGEVIVGVVNHEYRPVKYYLIVKIGKYYKSRVGPIQLDHEQKWEQPVKFSAQQERKNLKVEFLLFRQGDKKPYRCLHLWVNVTK